MDAGKLDHRLRIERPSTSQESAYGTRTVAWTTVATVRANVQESLPSQAETQAQGIRIANRPARVRIRYRPDLDSSMRVVDITRSDRVMKILTPPVEVGRRHWLEFMVSDFSTAGDAA